MGLILSLLELVRQHTNCSYPNDIKFTRVFHISLLKRFQGYSTSTTNPLPSNTYHNQPLLQLTLPYWIRPKKVNQHWVHWEDTPLEEATWEDQSQFQKLYSSFHLEDKVPPKWVSIVTNDRSHTPLPKQNEPCTEPGPIHKWPQEVEEINQGTQLAARLHQRQKREIQRELVVKTVNIVSCYDPTLQMISLDFCAQMLY